MMVVLYIISIIYFNSHWICGEEVKGNEEIKRSEEEITAVEEDRLLIELIPDLYRNYMDVLSNTNETKSQRRIFKNNREYQIHVEKLKGVNGYKKHNLIIKESTRDNPVIYINNPVETKIPNAYLTLQDFKDMLTGRINKQREKFKNDYLIPILRINKHMQGRAINIGITKRKRKRTTVFSTDKSKTESSMSIGISTSKGTTTENKKQYNNTVTFKTTDVTAINHILEKKIQSHIVNETTFAIITTEAVHKQNLNKVNENRTLQNELYQNSLINDTKLILDKNETVQVEILKKSLENVKENNLDATTIEVRDVKRSNLKRKRQNTTELDEKNQENENVEYTTESTTEIKSDITTEYKDKQTTNEEVIEQNISKIEENTTSDTTEDTPEVVTEQLEEATSDPKAVTEETTSTTIQTTRPRLSRPLVWVGDR